MTDSPDSIAADQLRAIVERAERLHEERDANASDLRELFAEAKHNGFDVKIVKKVIAIRKKGPVARSEEEAILDRYLLALGMNL